MCCSAGVWRGWVGRTPGNFLLLFCCFVLVVVVVVVVVANSWLVCTGVLKPVLKPAWRCWVGRTRSVGMDIPKLGRPSELPGGLAADAFTGLQHRLSPSTCFSPRLSPSHWLQHQLVPSTSCTIGCHLQVTAASAVAYNRLQHRLLPSIGFSIDGRRQMASASAVAPRWLQPPAIAVQQAAASAVAYNRLQQRLLPSIGFSIDGRPQIGFSIGYHRQMVSASAVAFK